MKKKSFLKVLMAVHSMLALAMGQTAKADDVTIGDLSSATNHSHLPMNSLYEYSYSQQIYNATEIGLSCTINAITVWMYGSTDLYEMPFDIYLVHTDKDEFSSTTDWIPVTASDMVYSGSVTVHNTSAEAYTFTLDTPFAYNGTDNLAVCFNNKTGNWKSGLNGMVATMGEGKYSIHVRRDGSAYDPYNMSSVTATSTVSARNVITFDITPSSAPAAPTTLVASNIAYNSATLTWDGSTGKYNVEIRKKGSDSWMRLVSNTTNKTASVTDGLQEETEYEARVQAVDLTDNTLVSTWKTITFTTPLRFLIPSNLNVELTQGNGTLATLTWTENGTATQWQLQYGTDDAFVDGTYTEVSVTGGVPSKVITGLTPETIYYVRVRAVYGEGESRWSDVFHFTPTDYHFFTINDGTEANAQVPIYGYWTDNITMSQFIIDAADLSSMKYGNIERLTFHSPNANTSWGAAEFEVYMAEVSNTSFSTSDIDWSGKDKVMSAGTLFIDSDGKMEITLDAPYQYMGGNLLIGILQTTSGTYKTCSWYGILANGASVGGYQGHLSIYGFLPKTTFFYTPGVAPSCIKPTYVTADNITDESAVISWTSDASAWTMRYREVGATQWTTVNLTATTYTITGLDAATEYEVQVQTNCGGGDYSDWTASCTFTTEICPLANQGTISYKLMDNYGDGWNGAMIQVKHHDSGVVVAELTATNHGSSGESVDEGTLNLCCGEDFDFVWVSGTYDKECSFYFYDVNDEEFLSYETDGSTGPTNGTLATYTMDCTINPCKRPQNLELAADPDRRSVELQWTPGSTDQTVWDVAYMADGDADFTIIEEVTSNPYTLTGLEPETDYIVKVRGNCGGGSVSNWSQELSFTTDVACPPLSDVCVDEVGPNSADISWTGSAEEYEVRYAPLPSITTTDETLLQYDNDNYSTTYGGSNEATWTWGVMYPGSLVTGNLLTGISIYEANTNTEDITINIYAGGDYEPGALLYTETVTPEALDAFHDIDFKSPVFLTPGENLWITLTETGSYVLNVCDDGSESNNQWIYYNGAWVCFTDLVSADVSWMIRGNMATTDFDLDNITWTTVSCDEDFCQLTGLQSEKDYIFQVRGNFGIDGFGNWVSGTFTTTIENPVVHNVEVTPLCNTATISWTGYSDSYKVRYRSTEQEVITSTTLSDDFESGINQWTVVRNNEGDEYTDWRIFDPSNFSLGITAHSGQYAAMSRSWDSSGKVGVNADNWLISPAITLDGTLSYWVIGNVGFGSNDYPEHYDIYVSTTTNDVDDFVKVYEPGDVTGEWVKHTVDLSSYNGATGYIAFRHTDYDQDFFLIDDVFVGTTANLPAGSWQEVNTTANSIELTGLESNLEYEYRIIGIKAGQANSETAIATFRTLVPSLDLNGDGNIDFGDVEVLANIVVGNISQAGYPISVLDVNNDGHVGVADVTALVNYIKSLP